MQITITARHTTIDDDLRVRAEELVEKLARKAHRPHDASIVFDEDHGKKLVEMRLHLPQGRIKVATAEGDDFRSTLDKAVEKLQHQLDKDPLSTTH